MKKIVLIIFIILLTGCGNLAENEVDKYLKKYQKLDNSVLYELNLLIDESELSNKTKKLYQRVYERQYENMDYKIMEYSCSKKTCDIPVEIEVYDYLKIQNDSINYLANNEEEFLNEEGIYDVDLYENYKLNLMKETTSRIKYTINLHLKKNLLGWQITSLDSNDLLKIHGIYE